MSPKQTSEVVVIFHLLYKDKYYARSRIKIEIEMINSVAIEMIYNYNSIIIDGTWNILISITRGHFWIDRRGGRGGVEFKRERSRPPLSIWSSHSQSIFGHWYFTNSFNVINHFSMGRFSWSVTVRRVVVSSFMDTLSHCNIVIFTFCWICYLLLL